MTESLTITTEPGTFEDRSEVIDMKTNLRTLKINEHVEAIIKLKHQQVIDDNLWRVERRRLTRIIVTALYVDLDVPNCREVQQRLCQTDNRHETPPPAD